jgi:hypothetical protein
MDKRKRTKYKHRSTKHKYKTKYRVTRTPLQIRGELKCSGTLEMSEYVFDFLQFTDSDGDVALHVFFYIALLIKPLYFYNNSLFMYIGKKVKDVFTHFKCQWRLENTDH